MEPTPEQVTQQVEQLFLEKDYKEIITLLSDELLTQYNNAALYAWRGRAHRGLDEIEFNFIYAQKSIEIDPLLSMGYLVRGHAWYRKGEYDKAITDYTEAIRLDPKNGNAYFNRALTWYFKKEYDKVIKDCNDAIRLDPNFAQAYNNRGLAWSDNNEYDKAIKDYNDAIRLDPNLVQAYINRGNAWHHKEEYDKAITDYNDAIRLDQTDGNAYNNRGLTWSKKKEYDKAITDYNDAIRLNPTYTLTYYHRGLTWSDKKEYDKAITDYERYIEITNDSSDYYRQIALAKIEELKKKIANAWYDEIDSIVNNIKQLLLFDNPCLTHYTSLSGARAMILDNSSFRLSEGAFLNDTSEGRELFNYLSFETAKRTTDETIAELFVERPFIGSFVAESKHNDLTLWRMYGKEAQAEAKGCALTVYKTKFIDNLKNKLGATGTKIEAQSQSDEQFTFYNVAYLSKDTFMIPGKSGSNESQLNELMSNLKDKIKKLTKKQKISIVKLLNDIAYLFKSSEYQYENEVRLVVQGVGFVKNIEKTSTPPKVYIELVDMVPALNKITLGPKVERADEWAAAFNYHIKEQLKDREEKIEIIISHLPFK